MRRLLVIVSALGLSSGCNSSTAAGPREFLSVSVEGVSFTASISKSTIQLGDTATLRFILRNDGSDTLRMSFAMGCPTLPYIRHSLSSQIVYPRGGSWGCITVVSGVVLPPGTERVHDLAVHAGVQPPAGFTGAALSPGQYGAYAELTNGAGRTNTVEFTVQD